MTTKRNSQLAGDRRSHHNSLRTAYQPGDSLLHRFHPLVKLAWLIFGTVAVFALDHPIEVVGIAVLAALAFPLNGLPLRKVRGLRLFAVTAVMLLIVQSIFTQSNDMLLRIGPVSITQAGIARGIYLAGRLLSVILLSYLFVLTTDPNDLAYALMRAGLPYRYGFVLITALRLVPVFEQEAQTVYQAQLMRGIAYDRGGLKRFLTLARQFFLPLLVSAMSKVDALAVSMEGRCFGKHPRRTFLRQVHFARRDAVALAILLACTIGLIALKSLTV